MQPFLQKTNQKSRRPWQMAAGLAAVFVIWYLDFLPDIRYPATGSVATSPTADLSSNPISNHWEPIIDRTSGRSDSPSERSTESGPVRHAIAAQSEPIGDGLPEFRDEPDVEGSGIQQVSAEVTSYIDNIEDSEPTSTQPEIPMVISAELAGQLRQIDEDYRQGKIMDAHAKLSKIYWKSPQDRSLIRDRIEHTAFLVFVSPDHQFSEPRIVQAGETLGAIASEYQVTAEYLAKLNHTSPDQIKAGQSLKVVRGPFSAVVDLNEFAMTIHAHGWYVRRYAIGTGEDDRTPVGSFKVEEKLRNPTWYNPDGGVVDADDPENPLGEHWLGLGNHIGIHGTIDQSTIGQAASRGCIHLGEDDIEEVFTLLRPGSEVKIRR